MLQNRLLALTLRCEIGQSKTESFRQRRTGALVAAVTLVLSTAAASQASAAPANRSRIALGRAIFFDLALSEPPGTSCASCHAPARAFSGNHGSSVGVPKGSRPNHFARRSSPSLLYLRYVPRFYFHLGDDDIQPSPFGGFFWDGRANSIAELVKEPLLNPDEMNNRDLTQIAQKIASAKYADNFRREFGDVFQNSSDTVTALGQALEAFLTSDEMAPFSSKYDAYLRGEAKLTALEARGLKLFKNRDKGNCISCHLFYDTSRKPERSLFTDSATMPSRRHATRKFQAIGMLSTSISASANVEIRPLRRTTKCGA